MANNVTQNAGAIDPSDSDARIREMETLLNASSPQVLAAAGSTQLGATLITSRKALVTVATTVSTHGVRLPVAVTGLEVLVANGATFGFKVYPFAGARIGAAATNVADTTLAINKANRYIATTALKWVVERGA